MSIGVAIGMAGALALSRVMSGLLYEVRSTDAVAFAGSAVVLATLAVFYLPPLRRWQTGVLVLSSFVFYTVNAIDAFG